MTVPDPSPCAPPDRAAHVLQFRRRPLAGLPPPEAACLRCRLRARCLPRGVDDAVLHDLDGALLDQRRLRRGQALYREGERFQHLHAVRSGSVKLAVAAPHGRELVSRIALPGDLLGLDGIASGRCAATATALEDSVACSVSFATLKALAAQRPDWHAALCRAMAQEIAREQQHLLLLGTAGTEARVADFLLDFAARLRQLGYSGAEFHLRVSRAEIGSYLGLTLETVSRTLSAFAREGWIEVHKRHLRIVAPERLQAVAGETGGPAWHARCG